MSAWAGLLNSRNMWEPENFSPLKDISLLSGNKLFYSSLSA